MVLNFFLKSGLGQSLPTCQTLVRMEVCDVVILFYGTVFNYFCQLLHKSYLAKEQGFSFEK